MTNNDQMANATLDYLAARPYWNETGNVYQGINLAYNRELHQLRKVLITLAINGLIERRGRGKPQWKIRVATWNRSSPLTEKAPDRSGAAALPTPAKDTSLQQLEMALDDLTGRLDDLESKAPTPAAAVKEIKIQIDKRPTVTLDERPHPALEKVLRLVAARLNVLLVGPAGCGKSYLGGQVARSLNLPFGHISCSTGMSEGHLLGRLLPTGDAGTFEYTRSPFVERYEEGGVFLFDEVDAADANTVIILNTALANGHLAVPNRTVAPTAGRHKDFVCLAAANTFGTGADRQYVGRNQLDEAFLDRFRIGQVVMDYDPGLEAYLCPDDNLRSRLLRYRSNAQAAKVRRVISTRFLKDAYAAKAAGLTDRDIDTALFSGWSTDEVTKVKGV